MVQVTERLKVQDELEVIRAEAGGILRAEDAVEWAAAHPESRLHSQLEWDDTKASHQYRIWQMRRIIDITVVLLPNQSEPVHAYVSLYSDRRNPRGGYRPLIEVLSDKTLRAQLLKQARRDLSLWREKYKELEELAMVFKAADQLEV